YSQVAMTTLVLTVFALFSLCHCAPVNDATRSVDPLDNLPIEAINEFWALKVDHPLLTEQRLNALKQWIAKWNLKAVERANPVLTRMAIVADATAVFAKSRSPEDAHRLEEVASKMSRYESHMMNRFDLHFVNEVEEENCIPHHFNAKEQKMIEQDRV
ncbi:hypothetical protein PFISCL1PPCAC_25782, partial [Pristionchus fissidentatus]